VHHVTQRANNRQAVFYSDNERLVYLTPGFVKPPPIGGAILLLTCLDQVMKSFMTHFLYPCAQRKTPEV
jgi:hypothetical protein